MGLEQHWTWINNPLVTGLNLVEVSQYSLCILAFSLVFHTISLKPSHFSKIATFFLSLVALKLLVSFIRRLVAYSARIIVHRQIDRQTVKQTHRPNTVTLAAHARRGLIIILCGNEGCMFYEAGL